MQQFSAPGKLFISGEWAILEVGNQGLVAAVNNRVYVTIKAAGQDGYAATAQEFGIRNARFEVMDGGVIFPDLDEKGKQTMRLVGEAIAVTLRFLEERGIRKKPFTITTDSSDTQLEVNGQIKKVGFGSSAAVVVATVAAILSFHGRPGIQEEIYKLATIAHFYAQGKVGSAFDVAASTYGGLFVYSRFDPAWLTQRIESSERLATIIAEPWPSLVIEEIPIPMQFRLLVGWTGDSASTSAMIKQMDSFKKANPDRYATLHQTIARVAEKAIDAVQRSNERELALALLENERLLRELGEASGVPIETPALRALSDLAAQSGAGGKLSGAGGGDCGIAICFDESIAQRIGERWKSAGLHLLDVTIDHDGVRKEN